MRMVAQDKGSSRNKQVTVILNQLEKAGTENGKQENSSSTGRQRARKQPG